MRFHLRFSLRALLLVVAAAAIGLFLVGLKSERDRERHRIECGRLLGALVGVLLDNYVSIHGVLPPAATVDELGTPLYSWRFELIPYTESSDFSYLDFSKAWDVPPNLAMAGTSHPYYCFENVAASSDDLWTNIFAVIGPGTAFDRRSLRHVDSDTILLVETRNSHVHWMQPGDLHIETIPSKIGVDGRICGVFRAGFHVAFADGEVWYLRHSVPFEDLRKFFTVREARAFRREEVLAPYRVN